jgi:hypothetical protein
MEEVVEEGDNVVVLVHITARGKASGVEVDVRFFAQIKVRDGNVVYIFDHDDRAAKQLGCRTSGTTSQHNIAAWPGLLLRAMRSSAQDAGCGIRHPRLALVSPVGAAPLSGLLCIGVGTSRRLPSYAKSGAFSGS